MFFLSRRRLRFIAFYLVVAAGGDSWWWASFSPTEKAEKLRWVRMTAEIACDSSLQTTPVPEISSENFCIEYGSKNVFSNTGRPLVIRGYASRWPAASKWTFQYLAAQDTSNTEVALSMGVEEVAAATVKRSSTFRDYCLELHALEARSQETQCNAPATSSARHSAGAAVSSGDGAAAAPTSQAGHSEHPGYLKQCELLSLFPALEHDIGTLPFAPSMCFVTPYGWIGARGAHTGLHQDDEANALVVLRGRKRLRLVHPSAAPLLSMNDKYDSGTNCCDASLLHPDLQSFPGLGRLSTPVYEVELGPGDALLFGVNWWHEAVSLSHSVSLNFFASSPWDMLLRGVPRGIGILAHEAGLYRAHSCVCHSDAQRKAAGEATTDAPSQATVPLAVLGVTAAVAAAVLLWKQREHRQGGAAHAT